MGVRSAVCCLATGHALAAVILGAALAAAPARAAEADTCALLSDADVAGVQGAAPAARVPSEQPGRSFRLAQCFFRTADLARSVSLAHALPIDPDRSAVRELWQRRFHGPEVAAMAAGTKKEKPPRAVDGVGDEAWWVGDARAGSLYVLSGDTFLRISVGGSADPDERMSRARALAEKALARISSPGSGARAAR